MSLSFCELARLQVVSFSSPNLHNFTSLCARGLRKKLLLLSVYQLAYFFNFLLIQKRLRFCQRQKTPIKTPKVELLRNLREVTGTSRSSVSYRNLARATFYTITNSIPGK